MKAARDGFPSADLVQWGPARARARVDSRVYDRPVKVRAAVLEEFGQPLAIQEVALAEPKAGEALIRLEACGVCHTDLYAGRALTQPDMSRVSSAMRAPAS